MVIMEIVQIVPDEIPETGSPEMEQIRSLAYSKPHVARKLISKDGRNAWILVKLRAFPSEDEWKQTGDGHALRNPAEVGVHRP